MNRDELLREHFGNMAFKFAKIEPIRVRRRIGGFQRSIVRLFIPGNLFRDCDGTGQAISKPQAQN